MRTVTIEEAQAQLAERGDPLGTARRRGEQAAQAGQAGAAAVIASGKSESLEALAWHLFVLPRRPMTFYPQPRCPRPQRGECPKKLRECPSPQYFCSRLPFP